VIARTIYTAMRGLHAGSSGEACLSFPKKTSGLALASLTNVNSETRETDTCFRYIWRNCNCIDKHIEEEIDLKT